MTKPRIKDASELTIKSRICSRATAFLLSTQCHVLCHTGDCGTRGEGPVGEPSGGLHALSEAVERLLDILDRRGRRRRKGDVEVFQVVNCLG